MVKKSSKKSSKKTVVSSNSNIWSMRFKFFAKWVGIPLLVYAVFFTFYTWPWVPNFSSAFFTDAGDGLQNVWNMWWIDKAVLELGELPWHTEFLHYPHGVTLIGQTLNPFNGFVGLFLLQFMSLIQAFNTMIIFSFLVGGLTAFWLCYYFTKAYIPSIVGGFIFTFSSYHFAHAIGHMQLVSLEWMPLFILLWWMFVKRPSYKLAVGAALALFLVLMCDYYYFLYCVITAIFIVGYFWIKKDLPPLKSWKTIRPLGVFVGLSAILSAPLPLTLVRLSSEDPFTGAHPAKGELSTNLLAPFIDGGFWRFGNLTDWYWSHVPGTVAESSVYIGLAVLVVTVIAIIKRSKIHQHINFWIVLGLFFGILSLGPRLTIGGNIIERIPMPYAFFEIVFPPLKLSGVPVRMMVMAIIATAVISAMVLAKLKLSRRRDLLLLSVFCIVVFIELWPARLPLTYPQIPGYVHALKQLPGNEGVFDNAATTAPYALLNQTVHEKPIVLGYISRTPQTVMDKDWLVVASLLESRYPAFCGTYKVRYYVTPAKKPLLNSQAKVVYSDTQTLIYDFKGTPGCIK